MMMMMMMTGKKWHRSNSFVGERISVLIKNIISVYQIMANL